MPSGRTQQEKGSHQQRYGPYTHIQPTPKKVKPQQERQRFKVQALSRLDAIANEGLQAVEAELTTMAWARNQQIWLRLDQPHGNRMHCEIADNHGEPLQMSNQEPYSVMVQINWTLKTQALANMQVQWRPKSAGKWHPFQWEAILHCPTAEGHRALPSSVSRTGDCMHVWLAGRADLLRLFQRTLFRQADPGRGAVPLHTAEHTPMRKKIRMTGGDKKEKKSGAHGAMVQITHRRGPVDTPHLLCPVEDGSNPGGDRDAPNNPNPPFFGRERGGARERERETERERERERG